MAYNGLLMGCTREYWVDIIRKIYNSYGIDKSWTWGDLQKKQPSITKSNLSRLKSSEWIVKDGEIKVKDKTGKKQIRIVRWRLANEAHNVCNCVKKPVVKKVVKKRCECVVK